MSENIAKREQARRVWRLNKKEGVPVLEALETAEISKDTYYKYKREYESEWETQLLTVNEVEERIERLTEQLEDIADYADSIENRLDRAEEVTEPMQQLDQVRSDANEAVRKSDRAMDKLELIEDRIGYEFDIEDSSVVSASEVMQRQQELEREFEGFEDVKRQIENLERRVDEDVRFLKKQIVKAAESGLLGTSDDLDINP